MHDEMNHLIEYYSVLRKSVQMVYGEGDGDKVRMGINAATESADDLLKMERFVSDGDSSD